MWLSQLKNMHKQNRATQSALTQSILKQSLFKQNILKQYEVWGTFIAISGVGHLCLLFFLFFLSGTPTAHVSLLVNKRLSGKQVDVLLAHAYSRRGANSTAKNRITGGAGKSGLAAAKTHAKNSAPARNPGEKKSAKAGTSFATKKNNVNVGNAQLSSKAAHKTTLGALKDAKNSAGKSTSNSQKLKAKKEKEKQLAQHKLAQEKRQKELEQKKAQSKKAEAKKVANKKTEKNKAEKKKELAKKIEQKKELVPEQKLEKSPEPGTPATPVSEPITPALEQVHQESESPSLVNAALGMLGLDQPVGADQVTDLVNQDTSMPVMIEEDAQDLESLLRYVALQKECSRCWRPPVGVNKAAACSIKISVDQQGKVYAVEMVEKSGIVMFDSAAKMTVYAMELPKWAYNKSLVITFKQE